MKITVQQRPSMIPGTRRQTVTTADGTAMQRMYVYLPPRVWAALQAAARRAGTSVSQLIATLANSGTDNLKDKNDRAIARKI
jgi:predicted DNA-binding ribbon-helix-helix protein